MKPFPLPAFTDNYIWILPDKTTFDCVDPGDAQPVIHYAQKQQMSLRSILLTHHHQDHIGGVAELVQAFPNCRVYAPVDPRIPYKTNEVREADVIVTGQYHFQILEIPGHTKTHIAYYEQTHDLLFCGDTLFSAGCGRVFDGSLEELHHSLTRLSQLPAQTKIYCGHEYTQQNLKFAQLVEPGNQEIGRYSQSLGRCSLPSRLKTEHLVNPFLRTGSVEVKAYAIKHGALSIEPLEVFKTLRAQKNLYG